MQDIEKQKIKTVLLKNASSVHFWCSVIGHRKESLEHHLLQCIHQNFAKQYNDSTDLLNIIVYWQVTDLGKDLCLLASVQLVLPKIGQHITAMRDNENNINSQMKLPCQVIGTTPGQSSLDYKSPP